MVLRKEGDRPPRSLRGTRRYWSRRTWKTGHSRDPRSSNTDGKAVSRLVANVFRVHESAINCLEARPGLVSESRFFATCADGVVACCDSTDLKVLRAWETPAGVEPLTVAAVPRKVAGGLGEADLLVGFADGSARTLGVDSGSWSGVIRVGSTPKCSGAWPGTGVVLFGLECGDLLAVLAGGVAKGVPRDPPLRGWSGSGSGSRDPDSDRVNLSRGGPVATLASQGPQPLDPRLGVRRKWPSLGRQIRRHGFGLDPLRRTRLEAGTPHRQCYAVRSRSRNRSLRHAGRLAAETR